MTIACSTWLRRARAAAGCRNGLYALGAWGSPASIATWSVRSWETGLSKNICAAAPMP